MMSHAALITEKHGEGWGRTQYRPDTQNNAQARDHTHTHSYPAYKTVKGDMAVREMCYNVFSQGDTIS